ncbi:hypothetical protein ATO13_21196 [Stappia sp. 22II-S9-Z10]|nr:hypothetical protein ATO13_21196 [Stappia sp. 22II-S9-Z10]
MGGYTFGEATRSLDDFGVVTKSEPLSSYVFGRVRGAYEIALGDAAYVTPSAAVDVINLDLEGYRERGRGRWTSSWRTRASCSWR